MKSKVQHQSQAQASTRNLSAQAVTAAVIDRMKSSRSDRFKQVMASLIEHLHAFARDVQLSEQEWAFAIDFLTKTGQSCTRSRQEFILLSDTLGLSTLVTQMNHPSQGKETEQTVAGARVDIWHADPRGEYDVQKPALDGAMRLRGVFHTDAAGRFHCWSIKPTCYPVPTDGPVGLLLKASKRHPMRPAHVHFMIDAKGFDRLITHVFEAGDRYIDSDAVFGVRDALIIPFKLKRNKTGPDGSVMHRSYYHIHYDFHMRTPKSKPKRQNKASR
ncbi:MAG: hydroxyquinol 1,2-dioxygenase [Betaproteobacteria bacterium]|nr:hydroxyquinol 1,2-dioxygenase [Betaproteobacteria bacterium]